MPGRAGGIHARHREARVRGELVPCPRGFSIGSVTPGERSTDISIPESDKMLLLPGGAVALYGREPSGERTHSEHNTRAINSDASTLV